MNPTLPLHCKTIIYLPMQPKLPSFPVQLSPLHFPSSLIHPLPFSATDFLPNPIPFKSNPIRSCLPRPSPFSNQPTLPPNTIARQVFDDNCRFQNSPVRANPPSGREVSLVRCTITIALISLSRLRWSTLPSNPSSH